MNSNKIIKYAYAAAFILGAVGISACDDVKEEDRFIPIERPDISRKVLIQEFTGIKCVNCPTGAATVHEIQALYPDAVIPVGLHPGGTGFSGPIGAFNLNTPLSRVYYEYYQPSGFPAAVIDGAAPLINVSLWSGAVSSALAVPAAGEIDIIPMYDADNRVLTVDYSVALNQIYNQSLSINIWVVENHIIGPQLSGSSLVPQYEHNHVYRASMTDDWGLKLADSFIPGDSFQGQVSLMLEANWVPENCQVVAFLQNNDKKVEQAEEAQVLPQE